MSGVMTSAPSGGWNARDALSEMPPNDAVKLVNLVPNGDGVKGRPGHAAHSGDLGGAVKTLVTYHGATEKLICAANGKIIDITAGGTGTNLGTGFSSDIWQTTEFKNRIIFCSGADGVRDYDGSTLNTTSISGATSADLISCTTHHGRVYYIEKDSQSFWYAAAGSYSGALTEFDLSQFTTTGGDLLYMISWTRDGGSGVDDLAAFVFSTGEILVYAGSDPGSATDWALLGRFQIGSPLGRRSATQIGGDVIILTVDGYVPLSAALQEGRYSEQSDFSFKIDTAAKEAAQQHRSNFGWSAMHWPEASWFVVNVPISGTESVQHVRNTTKGGWCKFTGLDASCWSVYSDDLYFGSPDGYVYKIAGTSDQGAFIPFEATMAFNFFGTAHEQKQVVAVEPVTDFFYPKYLDVKMHSDFNIKSLGSYTEPPEPAPNEWNTATWDVSQWTLTPSGTAKKARKNVSGKGYSLALSMRFKSRQQSVMWSATHYWINHIGIV